MRIDSRQPDRFAKIEEPILPIPCQCSSCGKKLKARDSAAGKKVKCPDCGASIAIPARKAKRQETDDDGELDLQKLNIEEGVEGPIEDSQQPCPMCGEMINVDASKCRYCGEDLARAAKKLARKKRQQSAGMSSSSADEQMTVSDWLLCIFFSGIGCIVSIIYLIMGKPKATKMLAVSAGMMVLGFVVGVVFQLVIIARLAAHAAQQQGGP